jgi:hypothetical protein
MSERRPPDDPTPAAGDRLRAALAALEARGVPRGHRRRGGTVRSALGGTVTEDAPALVGVLAADVIEACNAVPGEPTDVTHALRQGATAGQPGRVIYVQADDLHHLLDQAPGAPGAPGAVQRKGGD